MSEGDVDEAFARLKELYHDFRDALKNSRDDFDTIESNVKSLLTEIGRSEGLLSNDQCEFLLKASKFINSPQARLLSRRERSRSRSRRESLSSESLVSSSSVLGSTMDAATAIANGEVVDDGSGKSAADDGKGASSEGRVATDSSKNVNQRQNLSPEEMQVILDREKERLDWQHQIEDADDEEYEKQRALDDQRRAFEDQQRDQRRALDDQQRKLAKEAWERRWALEKKKIEIQQKILDTTKDPSTTPQLQQEIKVMDDDIEILSEKLKSSPSLNFDVKPGVKSASAPSEVAHTVDSTAGHANSPSPVIGVTSGSRPSAPTSH